MCPQRLKYLYGGLAQNSLATSTRTFFTLESAQEYVLVVDVCEVCNLAQEDTWCSFHTVYACTMPCVVTGSYRQKGVFRRQGSDWSLLLLDAWGSSVLLLFWRISHVRDKLLWEYVSALCEVMSGPCGATRGIPKMFAACFILGLIARQVSI